LRRLRPLLLLALTSSLQAQEESEAEPPAVRRETPSWSLSGGFRHLGGAGLGPGAEVSVARSDFGAWLGLPLGGGHRLSLGPYLRQYDYRFDGTSPLGSDPFSTIRSLGFRASLSDPLGEDWHLTNTILVENTESPGARLSGRTGKWIAWAGWETSEDLTFYGGAFFFEGIEERFAVPLLGFSWDFARSLGLRSDARGTRLEYRAAEDWRLSLGWDADVSQARLAPSDAVPDGVLQHLEFDLGIQASWQPAPGRSLRFGLLTNLFLDLELQDARGRRVADAQGDPGWILFLHGLWTF